MAFCDPIAEDIARQPSACIVRSRADRRIIQFQLVQGSRRMVRSIRDRTVWIRLLDHLATTVVRRSNRVRSARDGQRFAGFSAHIGRVERADELKLKLIRRIWSQSLADAG